VAFYLFRVFLICLLFLVIKIRGKEFKFYQNEVKRLFFTEILTLSLEGYLEYVITGYLQIKKVYLYDSVWGETVSVIVGYICLVLAFIVMPSLFYFVQISTYDELTELDDKIGVLYSGVRIQSKA
jgi:uncharacterized membrane protein